MVELFWGIEGVFKEGLVVIWVEVGGRLDGSLKLFL